jgi:hypothetical protein
VLSRLLHWRRPPAAAPLPRWKALVVFAYAMIACLVLNDALKVTMIRWRVLNAAARRPAGAPAPPKG